MDITQFKSRLDNKENIQLHNGDDLVVIGKSKYTNHYIFVFNTKVLIALKTFGSFAKKANDKIKQHSLVEQLED